jgi:hypothetical protein
MQICVLGSPKNTTAGQRAIAAAEAWNYAESRGMTGTGRKLGIEGTEVGTKARTYFGKLFGADEHQVDQARALLRDDPPAAALVTAA